MIFHVIRLLHFIGNSGLGCCLCASIIDAPISLLDCCQRQFKRWNNQTHSQNQQIKFKMSMHNMELKDEKKHVRSMGRGTNPYQNNSDKFSCSENVRPSQNHQCDAKSDS